MIYIEINLLSSLYCSPENEKPTIRARSDFGAHADTTELKAGWLTPYKNNKNPLLKAHNYENNVLQTSVYITSTIPWMKLVAKTMMGLYCMVKASKTKETPLMNIDPLKSLY